jgi:hypothetical protein
MTLTFETNTNETTAKVTESASSGEGVGSVPFTLWSSDTYFWTHRWQQDEGETLADKKGVVFDSDDPEDAAKWLRTDED